MSAYSTILTKSPSNTSFKWILVLLITGEKTAGKQRSKWITEEKDWNQRQVISNKKQAFWVHIINNFHLKQSSIIYWPTTDHNCSVNGFILLIIKASVRNFLNELSKPHGNLYQVLQIRLTNDGKLRLRELFVDLSQSQTCFQTLNTDTLHPLNQFMKKKESEEIRYGNFVS